jgi:hypothetical protein
MYTKPFPLPELQIGSRETGERVRGLIFKSPIKINQQQRKRKKHI